MGCNNNNYQSSNIDGNLKKEKKRLNALKNWKIDVKMLKKCNSRIENGGSPSLFYILAT